MPRESITFSVNCQATVRLTDYGWEALRKYYEGIGLAVPDHLVAKGSTGEPLSTTLWEIMQIFGPGLYMGAPGIPFVGNVIAIERTPPSEPPEGDTSTKGNP